MAEEYDLFISYSSRDRGFVLKLASDLKDKGLTVWLDQWEVKPGERLRERINDAIARCNYLLVLLSPNSINSQWVRVELDSAMIRELDSKQVVVIPTLFGDISDREIPPDLKGKHYLDFRDNKEYKNNLKRIIKLFPPLIGEHQKSLRRLAKAKMEFIDEPWRLIWPEEEKPELFAYKSPNRFDGICRIERINLPDDRVVIICEEIDENPGQSVTNCIEYLAFQICLQYDIDPQKLVLIEYYCTHYLHDEDWELVTFEKMPPEDTFQHPKWQQMREEDWHSLGLRPKKRRAKSLGRPTSNVVWLKPRR
jgi:TIR domain